MFCSKCGAKNHDDAGRCVICGATLEKPPKTTPTAATATPTTPGVAATVLPAAQGAPAQPVAVARVGTYLVPAILTTLFCCMPFGVVAIIYAAQVSTKLQAKDVAGAMKSSQSAKTWCWVSFGVGLAFGLFWLVAIIVGVISET